MSINTETFLVQIGETSDGKFAKCDFSSINNMLISGTTGSGKTNFIYSVLYSLMEQNDTSDVKFIIISSNTSDYSFLSGSGYLLCPLITDIRRVERTLAITYEEAAKRLEHRELDNSPHIFLIIDDFAWAAQGGVFLYGLKQYLMLTRLVKMHCILATSIPTASVVSSELKALLPYRVSFTTTSPDISRLVIGKSGAETLRYPGEMIYKCGNQMLTLNATYMDDVVDRIEKVDEKGEYDQKLLEELMLVDHNNGSSEPQDELFEDAVAFILKSGQASVSMLQRRFRIGYNRAARILDELEENGIVGPQDGARPRQVIISEESYYGIIAGLDEQEQTKRDDSIEFSVEIEDEKNASDERERLWNNIFEALSPEQQAKILNADYEDDY